MNDRRELARRELARRELARRELAARGPSSDASPETPQTEYAEPETFASKLPRNLLIGATHAGRNLHNLPHDLVQGAEGVAGRLSKLFGVAFSGLPGSEYVKNQNKPLSSYLPYDNQNYADVFGQVGSGTISDRMIQKATEHSPEILGLAGLGRAVLRKFPITQGGAARKLNEAEKLLAERGSYNIGVPEDMIGEAIPFLPKTHATKEMLKSVRQGEYSPSFSLQSQIGKHERDLRKSSLASERLLAPEARELKERILGKIESGLREQGHHDIADLLRGGIDDYRKYIKFREKVKPVIKKLGFPTSVVAFLGLGTSAGRKAASKLID